MILSTALTIGQITFILRVAIQILSYGGLFLIGRIILGSTPRLAPIDTHDLINRVVGKSTATSSSAKWVISRLRGKHGDPTPSITLLIALLLSLSYVGFAALSDIGFLGFYACSTPGPSKIARPASISSDEAAHELVVANLINGTDPSTVKVYRCDAAETIVFGKISENGCTAWHNSTYADPSLFTAINTTDTDALMPRQITRHPHLNTIDLNSYYFGPGAKPIRTTTIQNGLAIKPHDTGVTLVLGVPKMTSQQKVTLSKSMSLAVDVGCMALGIYTSQPASNINEGVDFLATNGTWRQYSGPDYLQGVLSKAADEIRAYYAPLFDNTTTSSMGFMAGYNKSSTLLSPAAKVTKFRLPTIGASFDTPQKAILGNCTDNLKHQLGLPVTNELDLGGMCGLLALSGSAATNGTLYYGMSRMLCATATQVNMVSATVEMDEREAASLNITQLPSDIHHVYADYWDPAVLGNVTNFVNFMPVERFTLSDDPTSPSTHFIVHRESWVGRSIGPGSGGGAFTRIGDMMFSINGFFSGDSDFIGLSLLQSGYDQLDLTPQIVTAWVGEISASAMLASVSYNGWAAKDSQPVMILSTGGEPASCYTPYYALGFFPLVLSATFVVLWALFMLMTSALHGVKQLEKLYAGTSPYVATVCPSATPSQTLLVWEANPQPHLQIVTKGYPIEGGPSETAVRYLH
jgi:hypothetical protein